MFTLGNKEAIVNSTRQYAPITVSSVIPGLNELMVIPGFGTFNALKLTSFTARRASAAQLDKLKITCPDPVLDLAITAVNTPVVVHLRVNSLRQASESAIDFIKRGRPLILEINLSPTDTPATTATKLYDALNEVSLKFLNATLPFTWAAPVGADITLTTTEGFFSFNESVTFLKRGDIFAFEATTTKIMAGAVATNASVPGALDEVVLTSLTNLPGGVNVGDVIITADSPTVQRLITELVVSTGTAIVTPPYAAPVAGPVAVTKVCKAVEAVNDGKYLEENVRMSTPFTSDTYAIKPQEVPIIGAVYTMVSWEMDEMEQGDGGWAGHKVGDIKATEFKNNRYTLYLNEAVCNGPAGQTATILLWAGANIGVVSSDDLKKANGAQSEPGPAVGAVEVADFLA